MLMGGTNLEVQTGIVLTDTSIPCNIYCIRRNFRMAKFSKSRLSAISKTLFLKMEPGFS